VAKFLFTTLPTNDLGLLTRSVPIARELSERGHSVVFSSPAKAPTVLLGEAGFKNIIPRHPLYDIAAGGDHSFKGLLSFLVSRKYLQRYPNIFSFLSRLIPALPIKTSYEAGNGWSLDEAAATMGMLNEGFVRANCEALRELIIESKADVVVDFLNPMAVMAARSIQKPIVTVIQANAHPDSKESAADKTSQKKTSAVAMVVNKVLSNYGLPPIQTLGDLIPGDLTLVVGTPETDPLPEYSDVAYVGSILWQQEHSELPRWIHELPDDKPLIWVYSGNPRYSMAKGMFDSIVVLKACIDALSNEEVNVVLTTGHHPLPSELKLPDNFRYEAFVPGLLMAERSSLLIHHGGYGSCQMGLYAGKASVIMPTYSERESNAKRIEALGAGIIVPVQNVSGKKCVSANELKDAVKCVLQDPSFSNNARKVGERLRTYGGATRAANLIEHLTIEVKRLVNSHAVGES
jgi:MGT family glycosyltransferase